MTDDHVVTALRGAVAELLDGYAEAARRVAELAPVEVQADLLLPLRAAADGAAAALAL